MHFYKITGQKHREMMAELTERRAAIAQAAEDASEEAAAIWKQQKPDKCPAFALQVVRFSHAAREPPLQFNAHWE